MVILLLLGIAGCSDYQQVPPLPDYELSVPGYFPLAEVPADNRMTRERVELGEKLFFDPILSRDSSVSCGSCHVPELGFADGKPLGVGVEGRLAMRNSPTVINSIYQPYLFMDGGSRNLEAQVVGPIENPNEMDIFIGEAAARLQDDPAYIKMFWDAYKRKPDEYGLVRAISAYERSLISFSSPYDKFVQGDDDALTSLEKRGMDLFMSNRTNCSSCHTPPLFTNFRFEHNGTSFDPEIDPGRMRVTGISGDAGSFKVPVLRNIELTGPYMHDGRIETLEDVIEQYNIGGSGHENQSPLIRPLDLNENERQELLAFLQALTDREMLLLHQ